MTPVASAAGLGCVSSVGKCLSRSDKMASFSKNNMAQVLHERQAITLSTLAALDAISTVSLIDTAKENGFRILRTEWFIRLKGVANGEGPILVGMAANLSAAEVEVTIESDPQAADTPVDGHNANRPVWPLGILENDGVGSAPSARQGVLKPQWSIPEGSFLNWWAYNLDGTALTTGGEVIIYAKHFGVWLRD